MNRLSSSRRQLLLGAAAAAASPLVAARGEPQPQVRDWFALVQQHHNLLEIGFRELLAADDAPYEQRKLQVRNVDYLIRAHSSAEENAIYPALLKGSGPGAHRDEMYLAEAHIKTLKWELEHGERGGGHWKPAAEALRDAVLHHAKDQEEAVVFPELHERLGREENLLLSRLYVQAFSRVLPVRT